MKVSDLMTRDVVTVAPDTPLRDAATLLATRGISGMPVVGDEGTVVGVLSEADIVMKASAESRGGRLLGWLLDSDPGLQDRIRARTAGDAMSTPPVTIVPDRPVYEAARVMVSDGVNRLPVVGEDGRLVGIITRADIVRAFSRSDAEIEDEIRNEILRRTLWLAPGSVKVEVEEGVVRLAGEVEGDADADLLPVFVARVPGVVAVESDVRARTGAALPS